MKKDFEEFMNGLKTMFTDLKTKGKRHKQIPNLITLSRLVLSCFIPPLVLSGGIVPAGIVASFALATDFIDGKIARKLNAVSEFGKNLDPVCDKLSAAILLAPLMIKLSPAMVSSLCVNLGLEAGISLVNLNSKVKGNIPRTTIAGKIKTASLFFLLGSSYLSFSITKFADAISWLEVLTLGLQTYTLAEYKIIDMVKDKAKQAAIEDVKNGKTKRDLTGKSKYYKEAYHKSYDDWKKIYDAQHSKEEDLPVVPEPEQTEPATANKPFANKVTDPTSPVITDPHALKRLTKEQLEALRNAAVGETTASDEILYLVEKGKIMIL